MKGMDRWMNVLALSLFVYILTNAKMGHVWVFYFFYASAFFADCYLVGKFIVWKYSGKAEEEETTIPPFRSPKRKSDQQK